jgi:hypothetical protein
MPPSNCDTTNKHILVSHKSIPVPDPFDADLKALKGGYAVHPPLAGPVAMSRDENITMLDKKKNQYDSIFKKGEAISLAPICNGIRKLAKVPLMPAVRTKKIMIVP